MAEKMEDCVMLVLSTFRKSEKAVLTAIQKAKSIKKLLVVFVADDNLAQFFIDMMERSSTFTAEHGLSPDLKDTCEADLLKLHGKEGCEHVKEIADKARSEGIEMRSVIRVGQCAAVCLDLVKQEKPSLIVTTRSQRPERVKEFFGTPVNDLIENRRRNL